MAQDYLCHHEIRPPGSVKHCVNYIKAGVIKQKEKHRSGVIIFKNLYDFRQGQVKRVGLLFTS